MIKEPLKSSVLIIDAGTTNVKVFLVDRDLNILSKETVQLNKNFPKNGWVEQDPEEIFKAIKILLRKLIKNYSNKNIVGIGITNQRETTVCWDKKTAKTVYPAIVWEDQRTLKFCNSLRKQTSTQMIKEKTGLDFLPYFSASKINWILENVPKAKELLNKKRLLFGTIDSWLIFRLTGGKMHLTDYTNASRTLLFNIKFLKWDNELLSLFKIPESLLPAVKNSFSSFGNLDKKIFGVDLPILAVIGDQQSSLYYAGNKFGTTKITYGTGAFVLQNLGKKFILTKNLFTTLAVGTNSRPVYALEGKLAPCGQLVARAWGKDRELKKVLKIIALKVSKLLARFPKNYRKILVDGGVSQSDFLITQQEKLSKVKIKRQKSFEGTALGTAKLIFDNLE